MPNYLRLSVLALGFALVLGLAALGPMQGGLLAVGWGLCIGSFLNVVVYRSPLIALRKRVRASLSRLAAGPRARREARLSRWLARHGLPALDTPFSLAAPRSRCPRCGHAIAAWENIPVLSYLLLRGRCRGCALPISWRYPLVELLCGFLTLVALLKWGWTPTGIGLAVLVWLTLPVALRELQRQRLPVGLLWAATVTGVLVHFAGRGPLAYVAVLVAVAGWAGARLLTSKKPPRSRRVLEALAALIGAWTGTTVTALLVGALSVVLVKLMSRRPRCAPATATLIVLFGWLFYIGVRHG